MKEDDIILLPLGVTIPTIECEVSQNDEYAVEAFFKPIEVHFNDGVNGEEIILPIRSHLPSRMYLEVNVYERG